ncbi:MAG TPA: phenylalanine--tRNA ligase beta subunit-related protein [Nitrososphaerales archaeon]|nr:phenylalanine--tRNA ligase beta subunit-related protein [Nitrososphaerales archaeon]
MEIEKTLHDKYPGLGVLEFVMQVVSRKHSTELEAFKKSKQEEIRKNVSSLDAIRDLLVIRAYRDFYWKVGIDPTKTRPAGEALLRKIIGGRDLPSINTLVDSYNLASAETMISIAAFDHAKVDPRRLLMRIAAKGETFVGIGMDSAMILNGVQVVIDDLSQKKLIAVYPYRDADESKVMEETTSVLFMMCGVPGISFADLEAAKKLTCNYVTTFCQP